VNRIILYRRQLAKPFLGHCENIGIRKDNAHANNIIVDKANAPNAATGSGRCSQAFDLKSNSLPIPAHQDGLIFIGDYIG
jgi:hypothetical protein